MPSEPTPTARPPSSREAPREWIAAKRQEFQDLLVLEGSLVRAGQLHLSTEKDHAFAMREMLRDRSFVTHQSTREQIETGFDREPDRQSARLALLLQHVGLRQHQASRDLFTNLAHRDAVLRREIAHCEGVLDGQDVANVGPDNHERELSMLRVQQDDLYAQARIALERAAMREAKDRLGASAIGPEAFEAVTSAGLDRVSQMATGLRRRVPLRRLLAVDIGYEHNRDAPSADRNASAPDLPPETEGHRR